MAVGSNGTRTAVVAFDLTISEDGFGGTSERRVSNWVECGGVWTCARFERDRREWESEARTMSRCLGWMGIDLGRRSGEVGGEDGGDLGTITGWLVLARSVFKP